jgi:hypothetical protein
MAHATSSDLAVGKTSKTKPPRESKHRLDVDAEEKSTKQSHRGRTTRGQDADIAGKSDKTKPPQKSQRGQNNNLRQLGGMGRANETVSAGCWSPTRKGRPRPWATLPSFSLTTSNGDRPAFFAPLRPFFSSLRETNLH